MDKEKNFKRLVIGSNARARRTSEIQTDAGLPLATPQGRRNRINFPAFGNVIKEDSREDPSARAGQANCRLQALPAEFLANKLELTAFSRFVRFLSTILHDRLPIIFRSRAERAKYGESQI
jgi:hypothetical protein